MTTTLPTFLYASCRRSEVRRERQRFMRVGTCYERQMLSYLFSPFVFVYSLSDTKRFKWKLKNIHANTELLVILSLWQLHKDPNAKTSICLPSYSNKHTQCNFNRKCYNQSLWFQSINQACYHLIHWAALCVCVCVCVCEWLSTYDKGETSVSPDLFTY